MKTQSLLLRFSDDEFKTIMTAYKNRLIEGDYILRSEFIRQLLEEGMKSLQPSKK